MAPGRRAVAWVKDDPFGVEFAEVSIARQRLSAEGVAIGSKPVPYRLDYELESAAGFVTTRLRVSSRGSGWRRSLDLRRDSACIWSVDVDQDGDFSLPPPGGDPALLRGACDCDLGLSPLTNTLPVLRLSVLSAGASAELKAAWVSVPDLAVHPDLQRYTFAPRGGDHCEVRYEALDGSFASDITLDPDGIVLEYPGIARRLREG